MLTAQLTDFVARLSDDEKAGVLELLLESIDPADAADESDPDGIIEATRRLEELDSGKVKALTEEELWAGVHADRRKK